MVSLAFAEDRSIALAHLEKRGFSIVKITPVDFPHYSTRLWLPLLVIQVSPGEAALAPTIFRAEISILDSPDVLKVGQTATLRVRITNKSESVWKAHGKSDGSNDINLGNKWLDNSGNTVVNDDGRTPLPGDVAPGQVLELRLTIKAPPSPGDYVLILDLVQENVSWFFDKGSAAAKLKVRVEP